MKQSKAVVEAIKRVCAENGVEFGGNMSERLTKEHKSAVYAILTEGFLSGAIDLSSDKRNEAFITKYVPGLVNNWLKKSPELNGGVKYTPKNPGSRTGASDESLKAMRALQKTYAKDSADYLEIQGFIDARIAELNASKVKTVAINTAALPEALRAKLEQ